MPTTLQTKFLEDSQGNKYAPVTTPNAVRWPNGDDLTDKLSVMGASGSSHASGLVPDTPSTAGTTKFLREDGTWAVPAGGGGDVSNKEDKMTIVIDNNSSTVTLSPQVGTLYNLLDSDIEEFTITLPVIPELPDITETTKVKSIVLVFSTSSTIQFTIECSQEQSAVILIDDGFTIKPFTVYEMNIMWCGITLGSIPIWSVSSKELTSI